MSSERPAADDLLTPREREVLEYLRLELTNEQIADELGISANGVKYHVSEILGKLGVRNRKEAARWPETRPWWAGALAPAAFVWRKAALVLPKPSALALVVSGGAMAVALGGLGFMAFLLVQGGKNVEERREEAVALLPSDPQPFVDEVLVAMDALDSYQAVFTVPGRPGDLRGETRVEMQFVAPDTHRNATAAFDGETEIRCEDDGPAEPRPGCYDVFTSITSRSLQETVLVGGRNHYTRECDEDGQNCGSWDEYRARSSVLMDLPGTFAFDGPISSLAQDLVVALELAENLHTFADSETPDEALVHLRGSVDNGRAQVESRRRILAPEKLASFATVCEVVRNFRQNCRETSYDEFMELWSEGPLSDGNIATIDVWVSPEDFLVRRASLSWPEQESSLPTPMTEYSLFNEVEIETPR